METTKKIIQAQAEAALMEGLLQGVEQVDKGIKETEKAQNAKPDGTANVDKMWLSELDSVRAEQAGAEMFGTFGLDRATTEAYMRELGEKASAPRSDQIQLIQAIGQLSGEMGTTPQILFPVALSIYIRNKDVKLTEGILSIVAKYESSSPGIGALSLAEKAAKGESVGAELMQTRIALMAAAGDHGSKGLAMTKDLERAIYGIIAPQSKAGAEIMETQRQRLKTQKSLEEAYMAIARVHALWGRQRLKKVQDAADYLVRIFPTIANSAPFDLWMRSIHSVAAVATIKEHVVGNAIQPQASAASPMQQINQSQPQAGFRGSNNTNEVVTAQAQGQKPVDLRQSVPAPAVNAPQTQSSLPNAQNIGQAANQAEMANKGIATDAAKDALAAFTGNAEIDNSLRQYIKSFELGEATLSSEMQTLKQLISQAGSTEYTGTGGNAVFMTPEQFTETAGRVYQLAQQQKTLLLQILDLLNRGLGEVKGDLTRRSAIANAIAYWRGKHAKVDSDVITAFELQLVGPIEQQINMLMPQKEYLKQGIEMAAMINNIGADQYVGPFSALCMQISQLRNQASKKYMQVASNAQVEPQVKNYCLLRARQQMQLALVAKNEGTMAVMRMTQGIFGGQSLIPTASHDGWYRLANSSKSEIEREADAELEDYWNELYQDSPGAEGYGTAIEHALEYHNVPTEDIPKSKMRRKTVD